MKRKLNILELRRLKECDQQNVGGYNVFGEGEMGSLRKKRLPSAVSNWHPSRTPKSSRKEDPREHQNLSREEIALMLMEVSEKIDRCSDFDLQKWLNRYESLSQGRTNFPEAAMLIVSAAQIYGRKVDYLEDIILHMDQDQKGRDDSKTSEEQDKPVKPTGRRRTTRFQPQSLSDCFSDLDFTFNDKKTASIDSLVARVEPIRVDQRNKFQQMQELCHELRTMPTKQRRQEILHRLRDEANIPPIMSSHKAARKNQILDLESGETIGTRYDYQIYLNFIDVRTGSLTPEHDLKRFFQRCDVIDYLFEQQECERERCKRSGIPAPEKVFPLMPREFKMYIPPDYLKNKYRIQMNDTSDFDNELHQAKISNYQGDPILDLLKSKFAVKVNEKVSQKSRTTSSKCSSPKSPTPEVSFSSALCSTRIEQNNMSLESTTEEQDSGAFDDGGEYLDDTPTTEQETSFDQPTSLVQSTKDSTTALTESDSSAYLTAQTSVESSQQPSRVSEKITESPENNDSAVEPEHELSTQNPNSDASVIEPQKPSLNESNRQNSIDNFKEHSPEPELMALENQPESTVDPRPAVVQPTSQSRLSYEDEGIGPDRDSPGKQSSRDLSRTTSLDKLSDCIGSLPKTPEPSKSPFFGSGSVIPKGVPMRTPALVTLNILKIPELQLKKHLLFSLPVEYRKMKTDLVRKTSIRKKEKITLAVYSLSPRAPKNMDWVNRPTTPEPEDFHGFDDLAADDEVLAESFDMYLPSSTPVSDGQRSNYSRASTPESDFYGFDIDDDRENVFPSERFTVSEAPPALTGIVSSQETEIAPPEATSSTKRSVEKVKTVLPKEKAEKSPSVSQPTTPNRTLSRDSGISDDQSDRRGSRSKESTPEPTSVPQECPIVVSEQVQNKPENRTTEVEVSIQEVTVIPNKKYIQSVTGAKEMIEKVNSWHRKLKPILIQSEKRNHFDIHAYGTEIIESFGPVDPVNPTPTISFAKVMQNKQEDFTARYFLSMLMLANTNNVHVFTRNKDSNRLTEKEDIELRLLSRKRHHQEVDCLGEKIPCDNTPASKPAKQKSKSSRGTKRKRLVSDTDDVISEQSNKLTGICRLQDDEETNHEFLDKIRRIYPDINSEETVRKRIAFRRGMRQYAYGLSTDETSKDQPMVQEIPVKPTAPPKPLNEEIDELLSVDLVTNEAVMVPAVTDRDPCCSRSIFSLGESGYESILGEGDC
ncbi:uncharacterized protein LOC131434513 [Malaya genurostris]|uniref:uncharacterized protein LOC131434513 n=1 Tax=Malaya genurostris TaxID=325434 RepID=UPI0026F4017E|nr:uncharacterized protein LOC131434513 [Malaya genurostris]